MPITISEAYRKRKYPKHFHSNLIDSVFENSETQGWLAFYLARRYISSQKYDELLGFSIKIGKLINYMLLNPEKFGVKK